jgi:hypothetical protein
MITWGFMVLASPADERHAAILMCPDDRALYGALASRLRIGGLRLVNTPRWDRLDVSATSCMVTVQDGHFTEMHTCRARMLATEKQPVTPLWLAAAESGKVVLILLPPLTLPALPAATLTGVSASQADMDSYGNLLVHLAARNQLLAGWATVLDVPAPIPGAGTARSKM